MATVAAQAAAAKLADDVVVIDVSGQLVITDCFVLASAANERQVKSVQVRLGASPATYHGLPRKPPTLADARCSAAVLPTTTAAA